MTAPGGTHVTVPPPPETPAGDHTGARGDVRWAVPWGVLDALGVLVVTVVVTGATVGVLQFLAPADPPAWLAGLMLPLPLVLLALVTVAWVRLRHGAVARLVGPAPARSRDWLVGFAAGIGAFVGVNVVLGLLLQALAALTGIDLPEPQEQLRRLAADPDLAPWLLVSAVVVAPIAEEVYFRGMLYQAIRRRLSAWAAIVLSAAAFALAHVAQEATGAGGALVVVLILPVGLFLGWLFERRAHLAAPIAAHAGFNLSTAAVLVLAASQSVLATPG